MDKTKTIEAFLERCKLFVNEEKLFSSGDPLLLAVSGGLDSVVLTDIIYTLGYTFSIAHCNFNLRGEESERDQDFVKQLSKHYHVPYYVETFDTAGFAFTNKCSIQEAARHLRYNWFESIINKQVLDKGMRKMRLLTAHHLDDNLETMLMNFFKGTGIAGMRGILPFTENVARPLLFARRNDLENYASFKGLKWVEDSSNLEDKYSRNYVRHQLIPLVEKLYPQALDNLADNLDRFRDIEKLYQLSVDRLTKGLIVQKGDEVHIPVEKIRLSPAIKTIVFEIIRRFGFSAPQSDEVLKLLDSQTGKYILSRTHRILKNRNWLIISAIEQSEKSVCIIEEMPAEINFPMGRLSLSAAKPMDKEFKQEDNSIAFLDASEIAFPLILRKWKTGDYFYPLGMRKKKK
ncbi:MAG: tRNA lysidine(34) synthetase TilS, partial [Chitinophagaceae bacterium]